MADREQAWGLRDVTVVLRDRVVLDAVTLPARPGEVAAVVGGDGAGKSTLLRTLVGRVVPAAGTVVVPDRSRVGYQPAASGTWANLTVDENLDVVARAYGVSAAVEVPRREVLLRAAGLLEARDCLAAALSGGMRQKLGFCMAILHEPELLVLDEPST
ncbi:MAG TPA: ABC transporter ATP-binding protein, partial [Acidimicrobiales bacterium]